MRDERLVLLEELENRYEVIPPRLLAAARGENVWLLAARGHEEFYRRMAFGQVGIIRAWRERGQDDEHFHADLRLYRERWHHWRREAQRLAAEAGTRASLARLLGSLQ
jgi:hypothetical protein